MKKRLKFQCWKCKKTYSLLREIEEGKPQLSVACPYCGSAAIVDLNPYRKTIDTIYRSGSFQNHKSEGAIYDFPDILPTQPES